MFETLCKMMLLTAECQNVIGMRMAKVSQGGGGALTEAALMWSEKTEAAFRCGPALLAGGSFDAMIEDYRAVVQANARRLGAPAS